MDEGGSLMDNIDREHRARRKIDSLHNAEIQSKESEEYQKGAKEVRQRLDVDDPIIRNRLRSRDKPHAHKSKIDGSPRQQKPFRATQPIKHVFFLDYANDRINNAEPREIGQVVKRRGAGDCRNKAKKENQDRQQRTLHTSRQGEEMI